MGLTESNSKHEIMQAKHKLIRRYNSEAYGDVTVVEDKEEKGRYALKEMVIDSKTMESLLAIRYKMKHDNLVELKEYWFQGEQSLCSDLRNISLLYDYFPKNLEQEFMTRAESDENNKIKYFGDWQILQILANGLDCLKYLQSMGYLHLITSMKSILYTNHNNSIRLIQNIDMVLYSHRNKKINIMGLQQPHKKNLPFHPSIETKLREHCDSCLDQNQIVYQNIFVLSIIALSLCFLRDPVELGVLVKGVYSFRKIKKRVNQIAKKFPNTHSVLCSLLLAAPDNIRYIDALKDISYERRSFKKQHKNAQKSIEIKPVEKQRQKQKTGESTNRQIAHSKKLSYFREARINSKALTSTSN